MANYVIESRNRQMTFGFIKKRESKRFIFWEAINDLESRNIKKGDWILISPFDNPKVNPGDVVLKRDGELCLFQAGIDIIGKAIKCRRFR